MKRKLFSAILFGALLTASTSGLTSCKDYDDDISNLQSQIDKLATADQLSAKVSELQAAISAAQSAAESKAAAAQTVADAAKSAAADAAAAASKAQSTADAASKDAAAAAAAAAEVQKAADKAIADLEAKAATKDELKAAADAAEAAVKAIQNAHATDKAEIEKAIEDGLAEVKAEIAKTNEALAALDVRLKAVEEKLAAIEAGEGQEEALKEIQTEVNAISDELKAIIGEYTTMVTSVDLVVGKYDGSYRNAIPDNLLSFIYVAQEKTTTFPAEEGVADAQIEFSSNNKNVTTTDSLVVRVSPTNAILNPENISLINSQGKELSDLVEVKEVKRFNTLQTSSVATRSMDEGNGLWTVVFGVKEGVDEEKLANAVAVTRGNYSYAIEFAVAVKNTESTDNRRVISSYSVEVDPEEYEPAWRGVLVENRDGAWRDIAELRNRFRVGLNGDNDWYGAYSYETKQKAKGIGEYKWEKDIEPQVEGTKTGITLAKAAGNDERWNNNYKLVDVAVGQDINICVASVLDGGQPSIQNKQGGIQTGNATGYAVKGFYVTLDKEFAIESNPSEWNAWKNYSYTNVGVPGTSKKAKLFYGNKGYISIDDEDAVGDIIGFRVYVVNLDGSLVDPDGRAFYVQVDKEKSTANLVDSEVALEAKLVSTNSDEKYGAHWGDNGNGKFQSDLVAVTEGIFDGTDYTDATIGTSFGYTNAQGNKVGDLLIDVNPSAYGNNAKVPVYGTDYKIVWYKSDKKTTTTKLSEIVYARVEIMKPQMFLDDAEYKVRGTIYRENGTEVRDFVLSFQKTMPTEIAKLAWVDAYDPTKQMFTNMKWSDPDIYKISYSTPQALVLFDKLNNLAYGSAHSNIGWYTLEFQNIASATATDKVVTVPNRLPGWSGTYDNGQGALRFSSYDLYIAGGDIDKEAHDIKYSYDFGAISLQFNYQTAQYSTPDEYKIYAAEPLSMTFNSWIDFEQVAWKDKAPTLRYLPGMMNTETTVQIGDYIAQNKEVTETKNYQVATEEVDAKGQAVKADIGYFVFAQTTQVAGVQMIGDTLFVHRYIKSTINGAGQTVKDTTYYCVNVDKTAKTAEYALSSNNKITFDPKATASDGSYLYSFKAYYTTPYTYTEKVRKDGKVEADFPLMAWNTEIRNYLTLTGDAIFGAANGKEVPFTGLIGNYIQTLRNANFEFSPASLYSVDYDKDKYTLTFKQLNYSANPTTNGQLKITGYDCFGHKKVWTLDIKIEK